MNKNSTPNEMKSEEKFSDLQIDEFFRNYDLISEMLNDINNPEELVEKILDEYTRRLKEIPATDILKVLSSPEPSEQQLKLKSLMMFATQATMIKERAEYLSTIEQKNRQLEKFSNDLTESNTKLKKLNEHYFNMLGFVSHELRSPLISVIGFADLLIEGNMGALNEQQKEAMDIIRRGANNLLNMIQKYLELSKIENNELQLNIRAANIQQDIIEPVLQELQHQLREKKMTVTHSGDDKIPDIIHLCDPELIRNVFYNLFSNAIKYGRSDSEIEYEIVNEPGFIKFIVENQCDGLPQDKLSLIFDKFTHLQLEVNNEQTRGTGLGLYITKTIVQAHSGKIWAESDSSSWVRIIFTLPKKQKIKGEPFRSSNEYDHYFSPPSDLGTTES